MGGLGGRRRLEKRGREKRSSEVGMRFLGSGETGLLEIAGTRTGLRGRMVI